MAYKKSKTKCIGVLTSGGDCPGLNAAIRAVAKAAMHEYGIKVIGIHDGFRGLVENRATQLTSRMVSGILTHGGTILGTSRDKPHKMPMGGKILDMTETAVENVRKLQIDCLVCLGGGGTQKNAFRLAKKGVNVITLPKTIDNDVAETDITFGFDTALTIAVEAIDRLHTTATSHHRIIVCEIMGHKAGWLALGAGIAGGADVILIPEIPYDLSAIGEYLDDRHRGGKQFSIVAVAEGAVSILESQTIEKERRKKKKKSKERKPIKKSGKKAPISDLGYHIVQEPRASKLARELQELTQTEARVTSLGHVQRGGTPSAFDRLLCTRLGTKAAQLLAKGKYNVMVAWKGDECVEVPLEQVAGKTKLIPPSHPMIQTARLVDTCLGEK